MSKSLYKKGITLGAFMYSGQRAMKKRTISAAKKSATVLFIPLILNFALINGQPFDFDDYLDSIISQVVYDLSAEAINEGELPIKFYIVSLLLFFDKLSRFLCIQFAAVNGRSPPASSSPADTS